MPRLKDRYLKEAVPALTKEFGYRNTMQVPRLEKVVVNMGVGQGREDSKLLDSAVRDMGLIAGQKPIITRAKRSISNFKIRTGMRICTVLITISLVRRPVV